ncbi:MAG: beta-glucosidase [Candidatus Firestonebacteria bacterium RIFOXYC2_FULL_39_67]|nr:MAG: beta-glucosidase [Candidatus Firestonebacteria bacterium RIFOXYD2_FULL_39_29]OGF54570.1 MAG: beta-glucosidase [Candidatus Firestonebacteria bacterium RIFOXYC2_FULL_39_67]
MKKGAKVLKFPKGFLWGAACSSFQAEGAWKEDGKSESIWDVFSKKPGIVKGGSDAKIAIDHYHRYKSDIKIMADLGFKVYRLSTSWSRIVPGGTGKVNEKGLDFYDRYIDELLKYGIKPFVNLYHWDMPNVQEQKGGFRNKETAHAFAKYSVAVVKRLGDRVKNWTTFNEIKHIWEGCYNSDWNAPGLHLSEKINNQVLHNTHLAHGLAVNAMRAYSTNDINIGLVHAMWIRMPRDPENKKDLRAAEKCFLDKNSRLLDPIYKGEYPDCMWKKGAEPGINKEEMKIISTPLEFFGLNVYGGCDVKYNSKNKSGWEEILFDPDTPVTAMNWGVTPKAMYWGIKHIWDNYNIKKLYISENGASYTDTITHDGRIHDTDRINFLNQYMSEMHRAIKDGYKVDGYFLWSLFDNFEWAQGYTQRFGCVYVDYPTQKRIWKDSAYWYKSVMKSNGIRI